VKVDALAWIAVSACWATCFAAIAAARSIRFPGMSWSRFASYAKHRRSLPRFLSLMKQLRSVLKLLLCTHRVVDGGRIPVTWHVCGRTHGRGSYF